jgi:hypothetical protein
MKIIQPSFTGGEISPSLYSRVDLARYGNSLKTCRNMMVSSYGGVYNRPGHSFIAATKASGASISRLLPFQFSITQNYVIELGDHYARFYANGAPLLSSGVPVEITTPWGVADIWAVHYTQSADVMYLAHPSYPTQVINRTSATTFTIAPYAPLEGPFQPVNPNSASTMAASGISGNITITSNTAGTFNANMVGMLVYLENKNVSSVKPWTAGEKNVAMGSLRRSAGKTYAATAASSGGIYVLCGGNAPQQDIGDAWDGPGDVRSDGTNNYSVGVLWTYIDAGYGIAQITAYVNSTTVNALVTKQMPAGVIGGAGTPAHSWTATGDGTTVTFAIAANSSPYDSQYQVTIAGVPTPSNPNVQPLPIGPIDNCVAVESFLPGGLIAHDVDGQRIALINHDTLAVSWETAHLISVAMEPCWRIESESGAWLIISKCTKCETLEIGYVHGEELEGMSLPCCGDDLRPVWERIVEVSDAGMQLVAKIDAKDHNYPAGGERGRYISTHNMRAGGKNS